MHRAHNTWILPSTVSSPTSFGAGPKRLVVAGPILEYCPMPEALSYRRAQWATKTSPRTGTAGWETDLISTRLGLATDHRQPFLLPERMPLSSGCYGSALKSGYLRTSIVALGSQIRKTSLFRPRTGERLTVAAIRPMPLKSKAQELPRGGPTGMNLFELESL